tara:strand:- start:3 stop:743 length:741 start_codon:yes stop_codon:yes gene_type:complete
MIFLELVPRNLETLYQNSKLFLDTFNDLSGINIPDIKRLPIRSHEAAQHLLNHNLTAIPHIRTQDASLSDHITAMQTLYAKGLRHVLLISGDPDNQSASFDSSPDMLCKELKNAFSDLTVYCGIDPYRQAYDDECRYAEKKLTAGADGLFSQPFFDVTLYKKYVKQFSTTHFFCGISPVTTEASFTYWKTINKVPFPTSFDLSLDYNIRLAKELLACSKSYNQHAYLMPIRTPVKAYLEQVFNALD